MKNLMHHVKFLGIIVIMTITGFGLIGCKQPTDSGGASVLTGTVSIIGTATVGQTLTANTGNLGGTGTITYQWKRGTTNIGTNSSTYTVQSTDAGYTITVTATRSGYSGSVTSNPTPGIGLPELTGTVSITGTATEGQTLTVNTGSLGGTGTISYQWKRETTDIGTNSRTYTLVAADAGSTITVFVTRSGNSGSVSSTAVSIPNPLTGTVTITGTTEVGEILAADISDLDGTGTISYQWKRGTTNIGTNSSTYIVQSADLASTITVTVTRSDNSGSITSDPTNPITTTVILSNLTANGSSTQTTTTLTLTFDKDITGLAATDITLTSGSIGVTRGSLTRTGTGIYQLAVSGITADGEITVLVTKAGYSISPTSRVVTIYRSGTATLSITFAQITDAAPTITGPTLYRISNDGPTSATLTVDNPSQYDSISWRVDSTTVTGTGSSFTLSAANTAYNLIGEHFVTVMVMKGGVPYNKTVSFRIVY